MTYVLPEMFGGAEALILIINCGRPQNSDCVGGSTSFDVVHLHVIAHAPILPFPTTCRSTRVPYQRILLVQEAVTRLNLTEVGQRGYRVLCLSDSDAPASTNDRSRSQNPGGAALDARCALHWLQTRPVVALIANEVDATQLLPLPRDLTRCAAGAPRRVQAALPHEQEDDGPCTAPGSPPRPRRSFTSQPSPARVPLFCASVAAAAAPFVALTADTGAADAPGRPHPCVPLGRPPCTLLAFVLNVYFARIAVHEMPPREKHRHLHTVYRYAEVP